MRRTPTDLHPPDNPVKRQDALPKTRPATPPSLDPRFAQERMARLRELTVLRNATAWFTGLMHPGDFLDQRGASLLPNADSVGQ